MEQLVATTTAPVADLQAGDRVPASRVEGPILSAAADLSTIPGPVPDGDRQATLAVRNVASHPLTSAYLVKLLLSLLAVVTLVYIASRLMRHVSPVNLRNRRLCVVESVMLGQRERAVIIRVDSREYLLGVSAGSVRHLDTLAVIPPEAQAAPGMPAVAKRVRERDLPSFVSTMKSARSTAGTTS